MRGNEEGKFWNVYVCINISIYPRILVHLSIARGNSGTGMLLTKLLHPIERNRFGLFRSIFRLYGSLQCCLHNLNTKASK